MTAYKEILETLLARRALAPHQVTAVMNALMSGELDAAQTAGLLIAWRAKKESAEEIATAAMVLQKFALQTESWPAPLTDTCGTGGDASGTFNISTAAAIVAAAAGVKIAKHGNRAVSGSTGSADVLEAAGVEISLQPSEVIRCIEETGLGFLFAPVYHTAMRHVGPVRKALSVRTIFNLLGPLANPAHADNRLLGVFDPTWLFPMARAATQLGVRHVLVVHGEDGMDEISISAKTRVVERVQDQESIYTLSPENFGFDLADKATISASGAAESLAIIKRVFAGEAGPARNVVAMNAGGAIYVSGMAKTLEEGVTIASTAIQSGAAENTLRKLCETTAQLRRERN